MKPYDRVLAIAKCYLGPAAESFLSRQCKIQLKIEATNLTNAHFKELAAWVEIAACRLIEAEKAAGMAKRIAVLC